MEIRSRQPFLSRLIVTPFIKPPEVLHPVFDKGLDGRINSFEIKFPLPSLIAICAPDIEVKKSLVKLVLAVFFKTGLIVEAIYRRTYHHYN